VRNVKNKILVRIISNFLFVAFVFCAFQLIYTPKKNILNTQAKFQKSESKNDNSSTEFFMEEEDDDLNDVKDSCFLKTPISLINSILFSTKHTQELVFFPLASISEIGNSQLKLFLLFNIIRI
jgi:hypothetical protein